MDLKTLFDQFEQLRREVVGKLHVHEALQRASNLIREALDAVESNKVNPQPDVPAETPSESETPAETAGESVEVQQV